jgi:hypothetical protein
MHGEVTGNAITQNFVVPIVLSLIARLIARRVPRPQFSF